MGLLCLALSAEPVRFAGGQLVLDQRRDTATLTGSAKAISGSNVLTASRIVVFQKEHYMVAEGNVILSNHAKKTLMKGPRIHYDNEAEVATATRVPGIDALPTLMKLDDQVMVQSDLIRGYTKEDRALAISNVYLVKKGGTNASNDMKAWADHGEFFQNLNTLRLSNRCRVETDQALAWCERATVVHGQETVLAEVAVHIIQWEGTNRGATNNLWALRVRYDYAGTNRQFLAWTNVVLLDAGDGSRMTGNFLRHRPASKYTYVQEQPRYFSGGGDLDISADLFERFEYSDLLYAKGNVKILSGDERAWASMAVSYKNDGLTVLYGSPRVENRSGSVLYAERISMRSGQRGFRMEGQIRGRFAEF